MEVRSDSTRTNICEAEALGGIDTQSAGKVRQVLRYIYYLQIVIILH